MIVEENKERQLLKINSANSKLVDENSAMNLLIKIASKDQLAKIFSNLSNKHNVAFLLYLDI